MIADVIADVIDDYNRRWFGVCGPLRHLVGAHRLGVSSLPVVHGNPNNRGSIRMIADRETLIDCDESHVDVPDLDLVLPHDAAALDDDAHDIAAQASAA